MNLLRGILCAGLHDTYLLTGFAMFNIAVLVVAAICT